MNTSTTANPWPTASCGDSVDTTPMELSVLGEHLDSCTRSHGRLFALHCAAERAGRFVAARIVTSLAVAVLLIGLASLIG
jgi:hypothetical protein